MKGLKIWTKAFLQDADAICTDNFKSLKVVLTFE